MQIRRIECFADFFYEQFQYFHSFRTLHVVAEGPFESGTVPGHVEFRYQHHLVLFAERNEFFGLFQGIIFARHAGCIDAVVYHRKDFAFQAPGLVLGEMPVENIDFVTG